MIDPTARCKTGVDWAYLLIWQPQFADKCHWHKLDEYEWTCLLIHQPQFHDKCPWHKKLQYSYWYTLRAQPQFRIKKLSTENNPYFNNINPRQLKRYLTTTNYKDLI